MPTDKQLSMIESLSRVASPLAEELGFELVDLQFIDHRRRPTVRVFIDGDKGVGHDQLASYSRNLGDRLDATDVIPGAYTLEVSSPGLDRPFGSLKQYQRSVGKAIEVLIKGPAGESTHWKGVLCEVSPERIILEVGRDRRMEIPMENIRRANRTVTF